MEHWVKVLVLTLGGALGVNARYWLGDWVSRWASPMFPWATFTINMTGSFAIGLCAVLLGRWFPHPHLRLLVIVGFLGGYTTFSSFEWETFSLMKDGARWLGLINIVGSVVLGYAAVWLGSILTGKR